MKHKAIQIYTGDTPSYEFDGEEGTQVKHSYVVSAELENGERYTHREPFDYECEAKAFAKKIVDSGSIIDITYWYNGEPWDGYLGYEESCIEYENQFRGL